MFLIVLGWTLLGLLAYKISQFDDEKTIFDPYEILGISHDASQSEIKRTFRKLSVLLHPDKETGDEGKFIKLTKAYRALTDTEAKNNWEQYGDPDGPSAISISIAIPSWITDEKNSVWVLGVYALIFMIVLPTVVGTWWYRSMKFSGGQILIDTTKMYFHYFHKTPNMHLKRIIMILCASFEFWQKLNPEVIERQSDNEEVPQLMRKLTNLSEKNKEKPLCFGYSIKARALLHAHLSRIPLNPATLDLDLRYIITKCPYLIQEQLNCLTYLVSQMPDPRKPTLETIENCMRLCPMIVQGLQQFKSPFLQLPYIIEYNLKYFTSKKRRIHSLQEFTGLNAVARRNVLENFTDEQYDNVMKVLGQMPHVDFQFTYEVLGDDSKEIAAGATVTVTVTVTRQDMSVIFGDDTVEATSFVHENGIEDAKESAGDGDVDQQQPKRPVWLKQKKGGGKKSNKKPSKHIKTHSKTKSITDDDLNSKSSSDLQIELVQNKISKDAEEEEPAGEESEEKSNKGSDREIDDTDRSSDESEDNYGDDDQSWKKYQKILQNKEKVFEGTSKLSHTVHCPKFPKEKQEYWWTYICDRKSRKLITVPFHITSLVDKKECLLVFTAPKKKGVYNYTVCLRCDSYLGFDQEKSMKFNVKEVPLQDSGDLKKTKSVKEDIDVSDYTTDSD